MDIFAASFSLPDNFPSFTWYRTFLSISYPICSIKLSTVNVYNIDKGPGGAVSEGDLYVVHSLVCLVDRGGVWVVDHPAQYRM